MRPPVVGLRAQLIGAVASSRVAGGGDFAERALIHQQRLQLRPRDQALRDDVWAISSLCSSANRKHETLNVFPVSPTCPKLVFLIAITSP